MNFKVNDRVIATDNWGNYTSEPGVVVGFHKNMMDKDLVEVKLDCCIRELSNYTFSVFYPSELTLAPES